MSASDVKNYGKSIRGKLLNIAKQESIFYQTILTRYFQERLLFRISQTKYRQNFYLKGGALMYAYEHLAARPTLDIDFLAANISNEIDNIIAVFKEICSVSFEEDGVIYNVQKISAQTITEFRDYQGIRLSVPVQMDTISQIMTMDIGFGDIVTPSPVELTYPILLDHLPGPNVMAYSLETVIAEKFHAIIDLANQNSRMKDYYDLYQLLQKYTFLPQILKLAIVNTFTNRHSIYDKNTMFFQKDFGLNPQMQIRWNAFLKKIGKRDFKSFENVVMYIQERLKPYWEDL